MQELRQRTHRTSSREEPIAARAMVMRRTGSVSVSERVVAPGFAQTLTLLDRRPAWSWGRGVGVPSWLLAPMSAGTPTPLPVGARSLAQGPTAAARKRVPCVVSSVLPAMFTPTHDTLGKWEVEERIVPGGLEGRQRGGHKDGNSPTTRGLRATSTTPATACLTMQFSATTQPMEHVPTTVEANVSLVVPFSSRVHVRRRSVSFVLVIADGDVPSHVISRPPRALRERALRGGQAHAARRGGGGSVPRWALPVSWSLPEQTHIEWEGLGGNHV